MLQEKLLQLILVQADLRLLHWLSPSSGLFFPWNEYKLGFLDERKPTIRLLRAGCGADGLRRRPVWRRSRGFGDRSRLRRRRRWRRTLGWRRGPFSRRCHIQLIFVGRIVDINNSIQLDRNQVWI